jgi:hypothetical protein
MTERRSYHLIDLIDLIGMRPGALEPLADPACPTPPGRQFAFNTRLTAGRRPEIELRVGAQQPEAHP